MERFFRPRRPYGSRSFRHAPVNMMNRTTCKIVTFTRPFVLDGLDGARPAGSYAVETAEESLQALSFPAWRRLYTTIRLPGTPGTSVLEQIATIDPGALDAALARDAAADLRDRTDNSARGAPSLSSAARPTP
jgi:hypothetical protein